jgi:hypothetical protein
VANPSTRRYHAPRSEREHAAKNPVAALRTLSKRGPLLAWLGHDCPGTGDEDKTERYVQRVQAVRGRLYFSYRPAQVLLAADPDAATHQAFGVPAFDFVEGENAALWPFRFTMQQFRSVLINPTREMPAPRSGFETNPVLNEKGGFQPSEVNQ